MYINIWCAHKFDLWNRDISQEWNKGLEWIEGGVYIILNFKKKEGIGICLFVYMNVCPDVRTYTKIIQNIVSI